MMCIAAAAVSRNRSASPRHVPVCRSRCVERYHPRSRHETLQRQVSGPVGHLDVGDVLETAWLRYVRLVGQPADRGRPVFLFPRALRSVSGTGQPDVLRIGSEPVDVRPQLLGGFRTVEAQPDQLGVVGRQAHGVESLAGDLVRSQVVDSVPPQGETRAAFHEKYLNAWLVSGPGLSAVVQHDRDSGELQVPAAFRRRIVHVQVGHRSAHVHL
jgi:hypothetical protein